MNSCDYNNISIMGKNCGNVDDLLNQYESQKKNIIKCLLLKPEEFVDKAWKYDGYLLSDSECRCRMGQGVISSPFSCYNCRNLSRLIDLKSELIDAPFQIEYGDREGLTLVVEKLGIVSPKLFWDENSVNEAIKYLNRYKMLSSCGTPKDITSMRSLRGDTFTIQILIRWLVEKIFEKKSMPHILKSHTSFICSDYGYNLQEHPGIGSFKKLCAIKEMLVEDKLQPTITRGIILQLLSILKTLSSYNFSHGNPSFKSLSFSRESVDYETNNLNIASPITLYISNFSCSSIMAKNIHFSSKTAQSDIYLKKASFTPDITVKSSANAHCDIGNNYQNDKNVCDMSNKKTNYYKLTNDTLDVYTSMRHIGFPLFVGSFDFYCFIVSLMCCKKFYDSVYSDEKLRKFWHMLWTIDDILILEEKFNYIHENEDIENYQSTISYDLIKGLWLRCNILDYSWSIAQEFLQD